jgi:hypothetical protein
VTDLLVTTETELLEVQDLQVELLDATEEAVLLELAQQGPPGPPGPQGEPGPIGTADGAFLVVNRFAEIADNETAKVQARLNLGVQNIDGGTFN